MVVTLDDIIVHQARDQVLARSQIKGRIRDRPLNDRRLPAANQRLDTRACQKLLKKHAGQRLAPFRSVRSNPELAAWLIRHGTSLANRGIDQSSFFGP